MTEYQHGRYWILHELRRVRASLRVGNTSELAASRERKVLQRDLVKLRKARRL